MAAVSPEHPDPMMTRLRTLSAIGVELDSVPHQKMQTGCQQAQPTATDSNRLLSKHCVNCVYLTDSNKCLRLGKRLESEHGQAYLGVRNASFALRGCC